MSIFDSSQCIWLAPDAHDRAPIQKLLAIAIPVQDASVPALDPIYIMNVLDDSTTYRSLILTHTGNVFASQRSTSWVAEAIFERIGFRYETWKNFWQEMAVLPSQTLPYVNGRTVFLKVHRKRKQIDWLNISRCVSMDLWTALRRGEASEPTLHFYFQLKQAEKICLGIRLAPQGTALSRQLALAIQFREAWQCYYATLVAKRLPRWYVNTQDEWQERFALLAASSKKQQMIDPNWLGAFLLYQAIDSYIEPGGTEQEQFVAQLLAKKCCDSQTLRRLVTWYRERRDVEE